MVSLIERSRAAIRIRDLWSSQIEKKEFYTDEKRFVTRGLAKAAGVYLSPKQIMQKAGEPLGDDEDLIKTFKSVAKGLQSSNLKAPTESMREVFRDISEMNSEIVKILANAEKMNRLGPGILKGWDFDKVSARASRLREAMEKIKKQSGELNAASLDVPLTLSKIIASLFETIP